MLIWMAIADRYKDLRSAQFDKKRLGLHMAVYFTPNAKAKIPCRIINTHGSNRNQGLHGDVWLPDWIQSKPVCHYEVSSGNWQ
jgi:hypothetical protein